MNRKKEPDFSQLISMFFGFLMIGGIISLYNWIFEKKTPEELQQEIVESMPIGTVEYFKNFDCEMLEYSPKKIILKKFFVVETQNTAICKLLDMNNYLYSTEKALSEYVTDDISQANVIIWINNIGKKEGKYSNGSPSIRKYAEVNFIEKTTKKIYKRIEFAYLGDAPQFIERQAGLSNNEEFFGERPDIKIRSAIVDEIIWSLENNPENYIDN